MCWLYLFTCIRTHAGGNVELVYEGMFREPRIKLTTSTALKAGSSVSINYANSNSKVVYQRGKFGSFNNCSLLEHITGCGEWNCLSKYDLTLCAMLTRLWTVYVQHAKVFCGRCFWSHARSIHSNTYTLSLNQAHASRIHAYMMQVGV